MYRPDTFPPPPQISLRVCLERLKAPRARGFGVGAPFFAALPYSLRDFKLFPPPFFHPIQTPILLPGVIWKLGRGVMASSSFRFCPKFMAAIKSIDSPDLTTRFMCMRPARSIIHQSGGGE